MYVYLIVLIYGFWVIFFVELVKICDITRGITHKVKYLLERNYENLKDEIF